MEWIFEIIYLIVVCLEFTTEYTDPLTEVKVRDLKKIAMRQLKENFIFHLITMIPIRLIKFPSVHYFFVLKVLRLRIAFQLLDEKMLFKQISDLNKLYREKLCSE